MLSTWTVSLTQPDVWTGVVVVVAGDEVELQAAAVKANVTMAKHQVLPFVERTITSISLRISDCPPGR